MHYMPHLFARTDGCLRIGRITRELRINKQMCCALVFANRTFQRLVKGWIIETILKSILCLGNP